MIRRLQLLALSWLVFAATPVFAATVTTDWFIITQLTTGFNAEDTLLVYGDFLNPVDESPNSCTYNILALYPKGTGSNQDTNSKNYAGAYKLLTAAFLAGKPVNVQWSDCISGYGSVRQVFVCLDSVSCGQ